MSFYKEELFMNMVDIKQSPIQSTVERIMYYLKNSSLRSSTITQKNNILIINFQAENSEAVIPSRDQLEHIREIVFWDNNIELPHEDNLFKYFDKKNYLRINLGNYDIAYNFFMAIRQFGVHVCSFDISKEEMFFAYKLSGRYHFNSEELDILQNLINPNINNHDSIRIVGFDGIYSIRIKLNK